MDPAGSSSESAAQLSSARALALGDAKFYPQILPAVVPYTGPESALDLRRWGADFIAETFASPVLPADSKQQLALQVLDRLKELLDSPKEDAGVVKSAVQAAASVYPLIFRHIIKNPGDEATWQKMAAIKSNILRRMDNAAPGVRICCLKFVQRVVQTQTPGLTDPRRPDQNEISLALVPRDHPLIPPSNLEAEASGLLDRLLGILQEDMSDALLVTATINSLGSLVRNRPTVANKIINQILNFNPVKLANSPMTSKTRVMVKSMEKTTRALLLNVLKKSSDNALNNRIQQYAERMDRMRKDFLDDSRKRPAPTEPIDGLDQHKRQRLGVPIEPPPQVSAPPIPANLTYGQLFSVTQDQTIRNFDATQIPIETVSKIIIPLLQAANDQKMDAALSIVRNRYSELSRTKREQMQTAMATNAVAPQPAVDDDDDYEPDFQPEDAEQILNKLDGGDNLPIDQESELTLGTFKLPPPEPFTPAQLIETSKSTISRVLGTMLATDDSMSKQKAPKAGFNRLAASTGGRTAWVTILIRIATRQTAGLDDMSMVKQEEKTPVEPNFIPKMIRETLLKYVIEDFRSRVGIAITWLNDEWYIEAQAAKTRRKQPDESKDSVNADADFATSRYWTKQVMGGILPYVDPRDKALLIRLLGEVPGMDREIVDLVKILAGDPERIDLVISALHYLILARPPIRDMCIDAVEDIYRNFEGAQSRAKKVLKIYRPQVLAVEMSSTDAGGAVGGASIQGDAPAVVKAEA